MVWSGRCPRPRPTTASKRAGNQVIAGPVAVANEQPQRNRNLRLAFVLMLLAAAFYIGFIAITAWQS